MSAACVFLLCLDSVVYAFEIGWKPGVVWLAIAIAVYARGRYDQARA